MALAESISHALDGRKSGKGFRVRGVCHGGEHRNLYIEDTADGIKAACHSHHCEYKTIMQAFEDMGLKPKSELNPKQRQVFIQQRTKRQLRESLFYEGHILLQFLNDRAGDIAKLSDRNYLKLHPEFTPMPEEPFERELEAAAETKKIIGQLYGI